LTYHLLDDIVLKTRWKITFFAIVRKISQIFESGDDIYEKN